MFVKMSAAALVSLLGAAAAAVGCGALVWLGQRVWSEAACLALCAMALLAGCALLLRGYLFLSTSAADL